MVMMSMGAGPETVRVPVKRNRKTGRYEPQTQRWRKRHGLGNALHPTLSPGAAFTRVQSPRDFHLGWAGLVAAGLSTYAASQQEGGGATGPGSATPPPGSGGSATNVSPNIQTEVSPQISPAFFQAQDSAGATQAATATQSGGGQTAKGGGASTSPASPSLPAFPSAATPTMPSAVPNFSYRYPTAADDLRTVRESQPFNWTPVYVGGAILAVVLVGSTLLKKRR